jgi:hypothetical protein
MPNGGFHPIALRVQALTLLSIGWPTERVEAATGIKTSSLRALRKKAHQRGYDPMKDPRIKLEYVEDGKRSGRPLKGAAAASTAAVAVAATAAADGTNGEEQQQQQQLNGEGVEDAVGEDEGLVEALLANGSAEHPVQGS